MLIQDNVAKMNVSVPHNSFSISWRMSHAPCGMTYEVIQLIRLIRVEVDEPSQHNFGMLTLARNERAVILVWLRGASRIGDG